MECCKYFIALLNFCILYQLVSGDLIRKSDVIFYEDAFFEGFLK